MIHFGPPVYPRASYVIPHVRPWSVRGPSVVRPSTFKYLRDRSKDFSNFLHEVSAPYGYKSDRIRFLKNNLWGSQIGETSIGVFLKFVAHISALLKCFEISYMFDCLSNLIDININIKAWITDYV